MRKWIILGFILVAAITLFVLNTIQINSAGTSLRPIYDALPQSTALFFEFQDIDQSFEKLNSRAYGSILLNNNGIKKLSRQTALLDSLIMEISQLKHRLAGRQCLAAAHITEVQKFDYLYLVNFGQTKKEALHTAIKSVKSWKVSERNYREEEIFELESNGVTLTCAYIDGIFIAGFTSFLVEESILQLISENEFSSSPDFKPLIKDNFQADLSIFVHYPELSRLFPLVFENEMDITKPLQQFAVWTRLDVNYKNEGVLFNGYTTVNDSTSLSRSKHTDIKELNLLNYSPSNLACLISYVSQKNSAPVDTSISIANYFKSWIGKQWAWGFLESFDKNITEESFLISTVRNAESAFDNLTELGRLSDSTFKIQTYGDVLYGQLILADTLATLFNSPYLNVSNPYFAVVKEVVVFANTEACLKSMINAINFRRTVTADIDYLKLAKNMSKGAVVSLYVNASKMDEWLMGNLLEANADSKTYRNFSPAGFQFSYFDKLFFTNGYIVYRDEIKTNTNFIWETQLLAKVISKPSFVTNHQTNETEIIVQDSLHNLYLIDKAGKILWKRNIEAAIMGKVYQIDYYQNDKLQFVFNTQRKIFIIDRNGNNVANFPIKLPSKAANGMVLVEYDKSKKYRYFLACTNKNIYGYYQTGKPLPGGWSPKRRAGYMEQPLVHIYNNKKDYLIAYNNEGDVFFFDRKGDKRVKPMLTKTYFPQPFAVIEVKKGFALVNADTSGSIFSINSRGGVTKFESGYTGGRYLGFSYTNLTEDKGMEYLFHDSSHFEIYNYKKEKVLDYNFEQNIDRPVFEVHFPNDEKRLGFYSDAQDLVYLFDDKLELYDNFPLKGSTPFDVADLNKNKEKVLVVGDNEGFIRAYKLP